MPVFDGGALLFFTAARAHHADVGGITPGSMPPDSTHIDQEGVLFDNFQLVENGQLREAALLELLASGTYPVRNPDPERGRHPGPGGRQRGAQRAGHDGGAVRPPRSAPTWAMSRTMPRRACGACSTCCRTASSPTPTTPAPVVRVTISIDTEARRANVDFTGTSAQQAGTSTRPRP